MKIKEFTILAAKRKELSGIAYNAKQDGNTERELEVRELIAAINAVLDAAPKVCVKFCLGYGWYYKEVTKLGKSYFDDTEKND